MNLTPQSAFHNYSDTTKNVSILITVSLILIIIFIISPFRLIGFRSVLLKMLIVSILGYALYNNYRGLRKLINIDGLFKQAKWSGIRNNWLLSCIFSILIFLLAIYVLVSLFN